MNGYRIKIKEQRSALLHIRITASAHALLLDMIARKQKTTYKKIVMADIIERALAFSDGQIVEFSKTDHDNPTEN